MDASELKTAVVISQPIDESEITDPIMDRAIKAGLYIFNKYLPKKNRNYISGGAYTLLEGESLLEVYDLTEMFTPNYASPAKHKVNGNTVLVFTPCCLVTCSNYDLDTIPTEYEEIFIKLVGLYVKSYCANIRRTATLSDLPFDLKGEDFYREFVEELEKLEIILQSKETGF